MTRTHGNPWSLRLQNNCGACLLSLREPAEGVSVRLDADTLARVDALIGQVPIEGREATLSDVLRALLLRGLDLREAAPPMERGEEREG